MKTLVVYYSLSGKTKKVATEQAEKESADIIEVKEKKPYSILTAFVLGAYAAKKQKTVEIEALKCDFTAYDKIILAAPIWGGFPAPPMNTVITMMPAGKDVAFVLTSGSGDSSKRAAKIKELVTKQGCRVVGYTDVKSSSL
ncbi:MAG TPA: NAD(P)H-dependent oxidoreductase [Clostridia bacterium]|nr:NAD(P)H-dependent oxidoreductase [Clostridia bacterium]